MENELTLMLYALLCFIGLLFVSNSAYIITAIYEAPPILSKTSRTLKDSLRYRNTFLLFLAGCNLLRGFTLYFSGMARDDCWQDGKYDLFYAVANHFKDVTNVGFAAAFSLITLFFAKLYKARLNPAVYRYLFFGAVGVLAIYFIVGFILILKADTQEEYEWDSSIVYVVVFGVLLLVMMYYALGLVWQVMQTEKRQSEELVPSNKEANEVKETSWTLAWRV